MSQPPKHLNTESATTGSQQSGLDFDAPGFGWAPDLTDRPLRQKIDIPLVAGVDEAGRGPLAGAVFAAAVILDPNQPIAGLNDSKKLTAKKREALAIEIKAKAHAWSIAYATVAEIDQLNILQASLLAMKRAVDGLAVSPLLALVDGNKAPPLKCRVQTMVDGDVLEPAISAASILAKTARDDDLDKLDETYPEYGFKQHKGYGTRLHMDKLMTLGPCPEHRQSFAPVKRAMDAVKQTQG